MTQLSDKKLSGFAAWLPDEPPLVDGEILGSQAVIDQDTGTVYVYMHRQGVNPLMYQFSKRDFSYNGQASICRDQEGREWFVKLEVYTPGEAVPVIHARPYKAPERFSGSGVVDQLLDIQESAKRIKRSVARFDLRQLGYSIGAASTAAAFCQARLNEQLQAGGVDSEFDREAIRRRVSAELFMADRVFRDLEDLNTLGEEFRRTNSDDPEIPF